MASVLAHLAIAKEYIRKNPEGVKNHQEFYDGSVMADLHVDKDFTHYLGKYENETDLVRRFKEKFNVEKFARHCKFDRDMNLAMLLHLFSDRSFFNELFPKEYLQTVSLKQFRADYSHVMDAHETFITEKYGVSFDMVSPEVGKALNQSLAEYKAKNAGKQVATDAKLVYSEKDLAKFIDFASSVDLQKLIKQSKTSGVSCGVGK